MASGGGRGTGVSARGAGAEPPLKSRVFVELVKEVLAREVLRGHTTARPRRARSGK